MKILGFTITRGRPSEAEIVEQFHRLYYNAGAVTGTHKNTFWFGVKTLKCPLDLWIYQEILFDLKPDLILETGTCHGGSAFFLASICDLLGHGRVVTIDIDPKENRPTHKRVRYLHGSSIAQNTVSLVQQEVSGSQTVLAILDSNHTKAHVLEELKIYSRFVTPGSYLIVEDSNINGHPVVPEYGPGPMEAIEEFLATTQDFSIDKAKEKFYLTYNPRGYLRKAGARVREKAGL